MSEDKKGPATEAFLQRWSRLKREEKLPVPEEKPRPELPATDKLTPESDYTGFMHPKVEDALRRAALKKLFGDPHFNTPDPFEPFSGDWTGGGEITQEMLATLNQARTHLFAEQKKEEEKAAEEQPKQVAEEKPKPADEPGKQDA